MSEKGNGNRELAASLEAIRARMDPYIWREGRELYLRGAGEDFEVRPDGSIQVTVLDPREVRKFNVSVERGRDGRFRAVCTCPFRIGGHCRHQVVGLEYLRALAEGREPGATEESPAPAPPTGSVLYRPRRAAMRVATCPDGSLLRVVLQSLGSLDVPHRVALQLFTGTGWTELRTGDVERWISRGAAGPHPRDRQLADHLVAEGELRREIDSEQLAIVLGLLASSGALVTRSGEPLPVSRYPWLLAGRIARGEKGGLAVALTCRPALPGAGAVSGAAGVSGTTGVSGTAAVSGAGARGPESSRDEGRPFSEVALVPSHQPWIQLETGAFHPLEAGIPGPLLAELQGEELSRLEGAELDRLLSEGVRSLELICGGRFETEPGLIEEVEGVSGARLMLEGDASRLEGTLELCYGGEWIEAPASPAPWTATLDGKIHRYPPAGQSLARAHRELEGLGFRRSAEPRSRGRGGAWSIEGENVLLSVLRPRARPFVQLVVPESLRELDLVSRPPILKLLVAEEGDLPAAGARGAGAGPVSGPISGPTEGGIAAPGRRGSGIQWLEISASFASAGREIALDLPALRAASAADPEGLFPLDDGSVVSLRDPAVRALLEIEDLGKIAGEESLSSGDGGALRVPFSALGEIAAEGPSRSVEFHGRVKALVDRLLSREPLAPALLDPELAAILRPYQREAVSWLHQLGSHGLAGILADEMGLGKTLMALAHLFGRPEEAPPASVEAGRGRKKGGGGGESRGAGKTEKENGDGAESAAPVLVVCPSSLVFNWLDECKRFLPRLRARGLYGLAPAEREAALRERWDLVVTSYALLRRDREAFEAREFRAVVLDEGQNIKNAASQTAQAACALRAGERWILTGTPIENHLGELWSLFRFLMPGFLGESEDFGKRYGEPIARGEDDAADRLRARVRPFILRRTKAQVLADLPPKIEQIERALMTPEQEALYREHLDRARGEVDQAGPRESRFAILAALTRLRQIACHPRLVLDKAPEKGGVKGGPKAPPSDPASGLTGGKFELCLELLEECIEEGHRVLLYSQFTSMLDLLEERLDERAIPRARLDGSTRDREGVVKRFQSDPTIPVFLISLKAGGHGLNLTQADTVILYDPWWNPAAEEQAAARAHRIGQTLPVHVHKLITAATVEEKILELQARKKDLAGRILGSEEEALATLTIDDLRGVLFGG